MPRWIAPPMAIQHGWRKRGKLRIVVSNSLNGIVAEPITIQPNFFKRVIRERSKA
jgi:hypothetical protein